MLEKLFLSKVPHMVSLNLQKIIICCVVPATLASAWSTVDCTNYQKLKQIRKKLVSQ